jgi:hypothetical protein
MFDIDKYEEYLTTKGRNLSEVRKYDSATVVNTTFTGDTGYKKVYLLDPKQGWIWTDAKYSEHSKQSIAKDDVDYYLQFRPYEHHPIGTYVFVPDDTNRDVGFSEDSPTNPFNDANFEEIFENGKLWMLVDRNNGTEFVRYMILQCNFNVKWVSRINGKNKILSVYGITRSANSYTAGIWVADKSVELDQITGLWIPDFYYIFKSNFANYGFDDTRLFIHDIRVMLTTNQLEPKCYKVTKVNELAPKGIFKCIVKQDEYDENKDNASLMVCNYYDNDGDVITDPVIPDEPNPQKTSSIYSAKMNKEGRLEKDVVINNDTSIGVASYYIAEFSDNKVGSAEWRISYVDTTEADKTLSEDRKKYYCGLLKIVDFGTSNSDEITISSVSVKPGKVKQLIGKKFLLTVQNHEGEYYNSIELEVKG